MFFSHYLKILELNTRTNLELVPPLSKIQIINKYSEIIQRYDRKNDLHLIKVIHKTFDRLIDHFNWLHIDDGSESCNVFSIYVCLQKRIAYYVWKILPNPIFLISYTMYQLYHISASESKKYIFIHIIIIAILSGANYRGNR